MRADIYPDLASLKAHLSSEDYRIRLLDRESWATVIAPHGGYIDAGTSAVAAAVAGKNYNLFDFQGLRPDLASQMHVTSTRFRDPDLSRLLEQSVVAVAIHWMGTTGDSTIWLGGLNTGLKALVLHYLTSAGFDVDPDSPRYRGVSADNVVNLPREKGVQLEISDELMGRLFKGRRFGPGARRPPTTPEFRKLVEAVRSALCQYRHLDRAASRLSVR